MVHSRTELYAVVHSRTDLNGVVQSVRVVRSCT